MSDSDKKIIRSALIIIIGFIFLALDIFDPENWEDKTRDDETNYRFPKKSIFFKCWAFGVLSIIELD